MGTFANTAQVYAQSTDPGAVGAGKQWNDTTNNKQYIRNSTNTDWIELVNENNGVFSSDVQFAPTDYVITDSVYTTPTTCTASSTTTGGADVTVTTSTDIVANLTAAPYYRVANKFATGHTIIGKTVSSVQVDLKRTGSPTGNITVGKYDSSGTLITTIGTLDSATISTSKTTYTFNTNSDTVANGEYIGIAHDSGTRNGSNYITVYGTSAGTDANVGKWVYNGSWLDDSASDVYMILTYNNYAVASMKDDKSNPTTNRHKTNSEAGAWVKADMGSAQELLGIAVHFHADTDITSFKIETSADDSTYTRRKTVSYSLITAGAWNLILFPRPATQARYVKITALDVGAKTISVNEMAVLVLTESVINRRHRLVNYPTATVSCETLTGA